MQALRPAALYLLLLVMPSDSTHDLRGRAQERWMLLRFESQSSLLPEGLMWADMASLKG